jgi:hypothetical protein
VSKNNLAAGVPPSGKFGASAAWYRLTLLTYNSLTVLRHRALPERFKRNEWGWACLHRSLSELT